MEAPVLGTRDEGGTAGWPSKHGTCSRSTTPTANEKPLALRSRLDLYLVIFNLPQNTRPNALMPRPYQAADYLVARGNLMAHAAVVLHLFFSGAPYLSAFIPQPKNCFYDIK